MFILWAQVFGDSKTNPKNEHGQPSYKIELLKFAAGTGVVTSTKVDVGDSFIERLRLYETAQGTMIGAGFYNKGNDWYNADGFVLIRFGANGEKSEKKTYEIPLAILNQYASAGDRRENAKKDGDGKAEVAYMRLQEVFVGGDGAIVLVGEQQFTSGASNATRFNYNDMLVTKIDAGGTLAWMKKLPKRQRGLTGYAGLSYEYMNNGDAHLFVFLDNEKNKDLPVTEEPATHVIGQGGILTAYTLNDKTGEVNKLSLLDIRDVQGIGLSQFRPSRMFDTTPNTFVLEAYKGSNEDVLVKIVLDK
jgi:hypothetical protein